MRIFHDFESLTRVMPDTKTIKKIGKPIFMHGTTDENRQQKD
jgi:hypothetical protein